MKAKDMVEVLKDMIVELKANPEKEVDLIVWDEQDNWEATSLTLHKPASCYELELMLAEPYVVGVER